MQSQWVRWVLGTLLGLALAACSSTPATEGQSRAEREKADQEAIFQEAEEALKDERYIIAVERYREFKNRFPYSPRATEAELRIADAYFEQESYIEAESAYEVFKELHPTHPKIDYVQYRIALSHYHQIPENPARDLGSAYRAIDAFQTLADKYPTSEYAAKAKEHIQESRKRLAEQERYIADFYFQRQHFLSASYRYASLLEEYPNLGYDEEALMRLARSYYNIKMYANAKDTLQRYKSKYPDSSEADSLIEELNKIQ